MSESEREVRAVRIDKEKLENSLLVCIWRIVLVQCLCVHKNKTKRAEMIRECKKYTMVSLLKSRCRAMYL